MPITKNHDPRCTNCNAFLFREEFDNQICYYCDNGIKSKTSSANRTQPSIVTSYRVQEIKMNSIIKAPNQQLSMYPNDGLTDVVSDSASLIKGRIMKFVDSRYMVGDEHIPEATRVAVAGAAVAWYHWKDAKPAEIIVKQTGVPFPLRSELGDNDETEWAAGPGGDKQDPWQMNHMLYFADMNSGATYTFTTTSIGGRMAVDDLKDAIRNYRMQHPGAKPVISLGTTPWKTKYGKRLRPNFRIAEWILPQGQSNDEPPEWVTDAIEDHRR
jgi:hypothetical protein